MSSEPSTSKLRSWPSGRFASPATEPWTPGALERATPCLRQDRSDDPVDPDARVGLEATVGAFDVDLQLRRARLQRAHDAENVGPEDRHAVPVRRGEGRCRGGADPVLDLVAG